MGAAPHRVRIVGGAWKRTPLQVPEVEGLRPTPDRVRETLFNWLGGDLAGASCLDLFAGTGALGLEAASRGAATVWLVEKDRRAQAAIRATIARLGAAQVSLLPGDALAALDRARREGLRFDLVLLDPPFGAGWLERVLPLLPPVLSEQAAIYVESGEALTEDVLGRLLGPGFRIARAGRAGQVFYHLVLRSIPQESD
ncbi:16S rRNA (guanine(966)-N(2))-methyltransferase RsmD [Quisquiliibacterium transsilvanicum]|uniref:16S rRNA (Guanine(966)-N(2))-methyltransferase RsmD n=1 Tax=Quisquiliibacterium transsilvanicum TaxID=1549638 RepID=A0A7W8HJD6_9BURK|nr:16S rRNA (guanine(966)-N(2))-methyltransferase RsmD [Quisquiliibacterium transsilvanicum]